MQYQRNTKVLITDYRQQVAVKVSGGSAANAAEPVIPNPDLHSFVFSLKGRVFQHS